MKYLIKLMQPDISLILQKDKTAIITDKKLAFTDLKFLEIMDCGIDNEKCNRMGIDVSKLVSKEGHIYCGINIGTARKINKFDFYNKRHEFLQFDEWNDDMYYIPILKLKKIPEINYIKKYGEPEEIDGFIYKTSMVFEKDVMGRNIGSFAEFQTPIMTRLKDNTSPTAFRCIFPININPYWGCEFKCLYCYVRYVCVHPDTRILTPSGFRKITNIKEGDNVISDKGVSRKVIEVMSRNVNENILNIHVSGLQLNGIEPLLRITKNHPILVIKRHEVICKKGYRTICNGNIKDFCMDCEKFNTTPEPKYIEAGSLGIKDFVKIGNINEVIDKVSIKISDYIDDKSSFTFTTLNGKEAIVPSSWNQGYTSKSMRGNPVYNNILIDDDFMSLCGYWLAEGNYDSNGRGDKYTALRFTFVTDNNIYRNDVFRLSEKVFGIKCVSRGGTGFNIGSRLVSSMFLKLFGEYSKSKNLPDWFLTLPTEKQYSFIVSLFRGEASYWESRNRISCTMYNHILIEKVWIILNRIRFYSNIEERDVEDYNGKWKCYRGTIEISNLGKYEKFVTDITLHKKEGGCKYIKKQREASKSIIDNNGNIYKQIREITEEKYEGKVYNLGVEQDNSYVANGVVVHNCGYYGMHTEEAIPSNFEIIRTEIHNGLHTNKDNILSNLIRKRYPIQIGVNTDPFQPSEEKYEVTYKIVKLLRDEFYPYNIITKNPVIAVKDKYLKELSESNVLFHCSIPFFNEEMAKKMEPNAPSPKDRIKAIKKLVDNNVHVTVRISPVMIGMNCNVDGTLNGYHYDGFLSELNDVGVDTIMTQSFLRNSILTRIFKSELGINYDKIYDDRWIRLYGKVIDKKELEHTTYIRYCKEIKKITDKYKMIYSAHCMDFSVSTTKTSCCPLDTFPEEKRKTWRKHGVNCVSLYQLVKEKNEKGEGVGIDDIKKEFNIENWEEFKKIWKTNFYVRKSFNMFRENGKLLLDEDNLSEVVYEFIEHWRNKENG